MDIRDYPKDYTGNLRRRGEILKLCENDLEFREGIKELCRVDILFWVNMFCWTKDTRVKPSELPFICYPYQEGYLKDIEKAIDEQYDLGTDKSRDMGVSWMVLYVIAHKWLFEQGADFRVGSRKEEFVDKPKVMDTLFEKLRYCIDKLPDWMLPKDYSWSEDSTYMKLYNPEGGCTIIGESANEDFGSGGRSRAILLDEFSKWEGNKADAAWTATADVTGCRLPVSTPKGASNKFAQLMNGTDEKIGRISLHWTLHPKKAAGAYYMEGSKKVLIKALADANRLWKEGIKVRSPWYDVEAERRTESDLAQEVDIDYLKSGNPFYDLVALTLQKSWEYGVRPNPASGIQYGHYITANLVEVNHKVKLMERPDGWLRVFELPKPERQYVIGGDTAEGLPKGDKCSAVVKDKWTLNTQATINKIMPPEEFAEKLLLLSKYYDEALTAPENNNHGYTTCKDFNELGGNLYFSRPEQSKSIVMKRGFSTTTQTRPAMLDQSAHNITKNATELRDPDIIAQCKTFVCNEASGKPEAEGDFHDDLVIANAICDYIIKLVPYKAPANRKRIKDVGRVRRAENANAGMKF